MKAPQPVAADARTAEEWEADSQPRLLAAHRDDFLPSPPTAPPPPAASHEKSEREKNDSK